MARTEWRWLHGLCCILLAGVVACGDPGDDDDNNPPPPTDSDSTPVNTELELGFDGEVPDLRVGPDGTLHLLVRFVQGPGATLYYARKSPTANQWSQAIKVPDSQNAGYRWFGWPSLAVGPDNKVHVAWVPEPRTRNGMYYTSCVKCDGTDWTSRGGESVKLTDDTVEFLEMCVTDKNLVHIVSMQLDRATASGPREQTDQMVHRFSVNGGENWEPSRTIVPIAFEELTMTCIGDDIHMTGAYLRANYLKGVGAGNNTWTWTTDKGIVYQGYGMSGVTSFVDATNRTLDSYLYHSWSKGEGPTGVWQTKYQGGATTLLSSINAPSYRPNNSVAGQEATGKRLAVWADGSSYLHYNFWDGATWAGDKALNDKIRPLDQTRGLSQAAVYNYAPGHGWNGRVLWPVVAMAEYKGNYHLVFRSPREAGAGGSTKSGKMHYMRLKPSEPAPAQ